MTLDLQAAIDSLRSLKSDLEAYYWDRSPRGSERYQIGIWLRLLSDRTAALESILMHNGTSRLRLCGVSAAEPTALQATVAVFENCVHENESFDGVVRLVAAALAAADRVALRAAGGTPETGNLVEIRVEPPPHDWTPGGRRRATIRAPQHNDG